jgi:hypothetical protein
MCLKLLSQLLLKVRAGPCWDFLSVIVATHFIRAFLLTHPNTGRDEEFLKNRIAYTDICFINAGIIGILPKVSAQFSGLLLVSPSEVIYGR